MKLFVSICAVLCITTAYGAKSVAVAPNKTQAIIKPKREAPLHGGGGGGGGGYHGPSYKYLPPGPGATYSSYDSYSGGSAAGHHRGSGYMSAGGHAGYNIASLGRAPKVETYIVQTQHAGGHGGASSGLGGYAGGASVLHADGGGAHGGWTGSLGGDGYKYAGASGGGYSGNSLGGYSGGAHGGLGDAGGGDNSGGHKVHTFVIPVRAISEGSYHQGAATHGSSFYSGGQEFGGHFGGGGGFGGYDSGSAGYSGDGQTGYQYATPAVSSYNGAGFASGLDHGYSFTSGNSGLGHGSANVGPATFGSSHSGGHQGIGSSSVHSSVPASTYGAPGGASGGVSYKHHANSAGTSSYASHSTDETPAYAVGHKGLGHFGYTASNPQALNTDIIGSTKHSYGGHGGHTSLGGGHGSKGGYASTAGFGKGSIAPFKPSTFLGTTYESAGGNSAGFHNSVSTEYGAPAVYQQQQQHYHQQHQQHHHQLSNQYLPPSDGHGYDAGSDAGSVHEPESTYLPPEVTTRQAYFPPADPSNSYLPPSNNAYLPPHH